MPTANKSENLAPGIRRALLRWYGRCRRDLPWRRRQDPYGVWIAEVILQQTQTGRGAEYYGRFVERFPDVRVLARAELDDVLRAWAGLGYYARARNLHAAARRIVEWFGARIPDTYEDLRSLPGIGDYIANGILSMAFDQSVPAVEANAIRVIVRLLALRTPPQRAEGRRARTYPVGVALIEREGCVVLVRREEGAALGGLWELPGARCKVGERLEACVRRAVRESVGRSVRVGGKVMRMEYGISGAHLRVHVFRRRFRGQQPRGDPAGQWWWVTWERALSEYGLSSAVRRLLEKIRP